MSELQSGQTWRVADWSEAKSESRGMIRNISPAAPSAMPAALAYHIGGERYEWMAFLPGYGSGHGIVDSLEAATAAADRWLIERCVSPVDVYPEALALYDALTKCWGGCGKPATRGNEYSDDETCDDCDTGLKHVVGRGGMFDLPEAAAIRALGNRLAERGR